MDFSIFIYFSTAVGIIPLITNFFKKEDLSWDSCLFVIIYFSLVGIGITNFIREPNTPSYWMTLLTYIFATLGSLYHVHKHKRYDKD